MQKDFLNQNNKYSKPKKKIRLYGVFLLVLWLSIVLIILIYGGLTKLDKVVFPKVSSKNIFYINNNEVVNGSYNIYLSVKNINQAKKLSHKLLKLKIASEIVKKDNEYEIQLLFSKFYDQSKIYGILKKHKFPIKKISMSSGK
jgi:hypothetical protein